MRVGFYNVWMGDTSHIVCADLMMRSVKRVMPDVEIVQFTDLESPPLYGVHHVQRFPRQPLALAIAEHYAACEGEWLFIDTDVIVQRDVRDVFDQDFDIAVAARTDTFVPEEEQSDFMKAMPYNAGVVFSRCPAFWAQLAADVAAMSLEAQQWIGVQQALCDRVAEGRYNVLTLSAIYNWPPKLVDEDLSAKAIVHYKGAGRKAWMLQQMVPV